MKVTLDNAVYHATKPAPTTQGQMDAYVLNLLGYDPNIAKDQVIGFAMLYFNIFYDTAKPMVEKALSHIHIGGTR